jgi:polysaccharide deacetylase 2 family uncharacterized protein YibQ
VSLPISRYLLGFLLPLCSAVAVAAADVRPVIAIIIDDLGQQRELSLAVTRLPGPVACSILPHTPWAKVVAESATRNGKEVMLHLPLQPMETERLAGVGEISLDNSRADLAQILAADLASVPNVVGINNHMGSLITRHPGHMSWLMAEIAAYGNLFFVDSYTTAQSVAQPAAAEHGIPSARRHVFLDDAPGVANLEKEYARLLILAREQGFAIAIGHPYPETTAFLRAQLPGLAAEGIELNSVAEVIARQNALLKQQQNSVLAGGL